MRKERRRSPYGDRSVDRWGRRRPFLGRRPKEPDLSRRLRPHTHLGLRNLPTKLIRSPSMGAAISNLASPEGPPPSLPRFGCRLTGGSQKTLSVKSSLPRTRTQRVSGEGRGGGEKQTGTSQKSVFGPGFLKFGIAAMGCVSKWGLCPHQRIERSRFSPDLRGRRDLEGFSVHSRQIGVKCYSRNPLNHLTYSF